MLHNHIARGALARLAVGTLALSLGPVLFGATAALAQTAATNAWVAPERRAHRPNPVPASAEAVARGRDLFQRECQGCHGKNGHGDGPKAGSLPTKPADLASARVQEQSDGALFWKITEGRGDMPDNNTALTEEERWTVIHYLRSLGGHPQTLVNTGP